MLPSISFPASHYCHQIIRYYRVLLTNYVVKETENKNLLSIPNSEFEDDLQPYCKAEIHLKSVKMVYVLRARID
jgi:hypothetical protein